MFRNPYADGLIVIVILLLFFGPKRLPTLGRSLGTGLREFKDSITGSHDRDGDEDEEHPALAATPAPPVSPPQAPVAEPQNVPRHEPAQGQTPSEQR